MRRLTSLLCLLLAPVPALAEVVWKSNFEVGNRSEWSSTQMVDVSRLLVVKEVAREGERSLKATVIKGDNPIQASGNRNELIRQTREAPGSEYWYRWSVRFGSTFPSVKTWQLFTQWHHDGCCGSPPVEFYVYGEEVRLNVGGSPGTQVWMTPLKRGVWYDFVFHVRWSPDPKVGMVHLFLNGKEVLAPRAIATQFKDAKGQPVLNYLKAGYYRNESISAPGHLYLDDFMMGTTKEDVFPEEKPVPPPPATDAGVPAKTQSGRADGGTAGQDCKCSGTVGQ